MTHHRDPLHACIPSATHPRTVTESPRETPVDHDTDVLVVGGGPAGIGAAIASALAGARTTLLERHGVLGGVWTAGLLNPLFDWKGQGHVVAGLVQRLTNAGAWKAWKAERGWYCFDTETLAWTLDRWCAELGIDVRFESPAVAAVMTGDRVSGAVVEGRSGRRAILAHTTIDATGDGQFAALTGAEYELGRESDGLCQPMTLMFEIGGLPPGFNQTTSEWLYDALMTAKEKSGLPHRLPFERVNYAPWIINLPGPGRAAVQHTHHYRVSALDGKSVSQALAEGRRLAREAVELMAHIPGLETVHLLRTASAMGVREGRRIRGDAHVDLDTVTGGKAFADGIAVGRFAVDIHEPAPGAGVPSNHHTPMRPYEIPLGALRPRGVGHLLTAGRCISGSHEAHASYRVTGTAMAMGQAAGITAAWAAREKIPVRDIPGERVRQELQEHGTEFLN